MTMSTLTLAAGDKPNPVGHVVDHPFIMSGEWVVWSSIMTNLALSAIIMLVVGMWAARKIATGNESEGHERFVTRNPFAHMLEVICSYLRDETVRPLLHSRTDRYMPFLWTVFFFILVNNLLGLIPLLDIVGLVNPEMVHDEHRSFIGGTATQSIYVTAVLAIIAAITINIAGVKELGLKGYISHLTAGAPIFVWPIIIPIELAGIMIKPAALSIRLFANMTAGHILLATLFAFGKMGFDGGFAVGIPVLIASFLGSLGVYALEIFVAFLQAFVFMFLTTVFISLLSHHAEDDHDEHHGYDEKTEHLADAAAAALA